MPRHGLEHHDLHDVDDDHHHVDLDVVLGLTALSWVLLIPAVLCWPVVGFAIYLIWRWAKRSGEADEAQRRALLEAARREETPQ